MHRDRPIAIQGAQIFSKRSIVDRFIVTVDHFNRTVTPKCTIKQDVLRCSKAFELEIKKLICLDTSPRVSLDLIVFYSHFCTSGAFEIKIWWNILGESALAPHPRVLCVLSD